MKKDKKQPSFEASIARLQEITKALETGNLPLEEGVTLYKEGISLAKLCRDQLENAQNEIKIYADGLKDFPFDPDGSEQE